MAVFSTRYRQKLQKESHQEDIPERHSCVCVHCGQQFSGEEKIGFINTSFDTEFAESDDNS